MATPFLSKLVLTPLDTSEDVPETRDARQEWELYQSFSVRLPDGRILIVPAGFVTDLASVPRVFLNAVPADGPWVRAAVVHDYLYNTKGLGGAYTRAQSDAILRQLMASLHVSTPYRLAIWAAVRVGGWKGWGS